MPDEPQEQQTQEEQVVEAPQYEEGSPEAEAALADEAFGLNDLPEPEPQETDEQVETEQEEETSVVEELDGDDDSEAGEEPDDSLDDGLVRQAGELGIETDGIGSNAELQRLVNVVNKRFANLGAPQQTQPNPQQPTQPTEKPAVDEEIPEFKLPEDLDEEIAAPVKQAVDYYSKRASKAEQQMQQVQQQLNAFVQQSVFDGFDRFMDSLGDDYAETFGKGTRYDVGQDAVKARAELFNEAEALARGYRSQGIQVRDEEIYKRALAMKYPELGKASVSKRIQEQQTKRKRATTSPPNRRAGKQATQTPKSKSNDPIQRAIAYATEQRAKLGLMTADEENPLALE